MEKRYNERSWAVDVVSEGKRILDRRRGVIRSIGAEWTLASPEGMLFPDVLLFEDESGTSVLQGWELKMPETPVTDSKFLENAKIKAKRLGLKHFLVWNVTTAVLHRTEDFSDYPAVHSWPSLTQIASRDQVWPRRAEWIRLLGTILDDLEQFFRTAELTGRNLIATFSETSIVDALLANAGPVSEAIARKARSNGALDAEIRLWWASVKGEYPLEDDRFAVLSRIVLANWINRVVFAHVLKSRYKAAEGVERIEATTPIAEACGIFSTITEACDFWTVFQPFLGETCLSDGFWRQLAQFNALMSRVRFNELGQSILAHFLEKAVVSWQRKLAGQFSTPPALADVLVAVTVLDKNELFFDPFCGTGTIPRAAYQAKVRSGLRVGVAHQGIWASDKFPFPLQVASIALSPPDCMGMMLHVFKADAMSLRSGQPQEFMHPNTGARVTERLPSFRFIASNLPFVKQEDLRVANPAIELVNEFITKGSALAEGLNPRSDLFAYLPFHLWNLLSNEGRLGIIVSNSWLGTDWGKTFRDVLRWFFQIEKVVISAAGRWFQNSDVVTTMVVLNKRPKPAPPPGEEKTAFFCTETPLSEWGRGLVSQTIADLILLGRNQPGLVSGRVYSQREIGQHESLGMEWSSFFADLDWVGGIRDKLVKADDLFVIARGKRRGWDPLFYPNGKHGIEAQYLRPVLKSPKSVQGLLAEPDADAFCCSRSLKELAALGHRGALRWIRGFAHAVNEKGEPLPEALGKAGPWFQMGESTEADLVMHINPDRRLFVAKMAQRGFVNQRLTGLTVRSPQTDVGLCHALLNSIVGIFYIEALGFGRGLGVLDLNATKMRENLHVLNPSIPSARARQSILAAFQSLLDRDVEPIEEELRRDDRRRFDRMVLAAYGIEELYQSIVGSFNTLYRIRKAVEN